jgi:hypothetical protein
MIQEKCVPKLIFVVRRGHGPLVPHLVISLRSPSQYLQIPFQPSQSPRLSSEVSNLTSITQISSSYKVASPKFDLPLLPFDPFFIHPRVFNMCPIAIIGTGEKAAGTRIFKNVRTRPRRRGKEREARRRYYGAPF